VKNAFYLLIGLFLFLLAIDLIGNSFKLLNKEVVESILQLTSNPFIGLFIGLLITALIQSSSTSTSMVVAIVASGSIGLSEAIPMIMGANVGTTLTSTLVSLSFITKKEEFRKALSAGVVHDFFNILVVAILFPLEYYYGLLTNLSSSISTLIVGNNYGSIQSEYGYSVFTRPIIDWITGLFPFPIILSILAFAILALSIKVISKILYKTITGGSKEVLQRYFFGGPYRSFLWGAAITAGIQSSSVTTSVIVPFVATRKIKLKQAFTFIMGANVGTTLTALIAATFKSEAAISIALVHLLFNLFGVLIFLPFPFIRKIPVNLARNFGRRANDARILGFVYIIFTFFVIPFILISYTNARQDRVELTYEINKKSNGETNFKKIVVKEFDANHLNHWFVYEGLKTKEEATDVPTEILEAYYKKNLMILDNMVFKLGSINECWSGSDELGNYNICLKDMEVVYKRGSLTLDSVYAFEKRYSVDSLGWEKIYVDPVRQIIVKSLLYDDAGDLTSSEVLVELSKL
jgi:sodium-dependent phosphate cotransporter